MKRTAARSIGAVLVLLAPMLAHAVPIHWELNGSFWPTGSAYGSFTYDADTGAFSDIALRTSADSPSGGLLFTEFLAEIPGPTSGDVNPGSLVFIQPNVQPGWTTIAFMLPSIQLSLLTNAGGVLPIDTRPNTQDFAEFSCSLSINGCASGGGANVSNWLKGVSNTLTGTPLSVAEPSAALLLAMGLAGANLARRRVRAER